MNAKLYSNALLGAANPQTLKDRANKIGIVLEQAKNFIRSHQTAQQFRSVNPVPFHVPIVAKPNQYACDLMFVQRGAEKVPILVVEDLLLLQRIRQLVRTQQSALVRLLQCRCPIGTAPLITCRAWLHIS
jgi:hypothetical protein